jgi:putative transcriptional regulator
MKTTPSAPHKFLIAMPDQTTGFFDKSVILMLEHNHNGAMGLTLTQTANTSVKDIIKNFDFKLSDEDAFDDPVMIGGPVQPERGFILHRKPSRWESTVILEQDLSLTVSVDFLHSAAQGLIFEDFQVFLGYAGWEPGQLESEIKQNAWLFTDVDVRIIFDTPPEARWQAAFDSIGIDPARLCRTLGHA